MFWILKLIVLILLMAIMHPAFTQTTLRGVIVHKDQPAAGATISFGKRNAVSDSAGRFSFSSLAAGKHLLHITMTGFEPIHEYISIVENETRDIRIELTEMPASLDALVVTGTMKPMRKLESPIAVEVYSPQFFRKNPTPSIFESLQNVNGVRPQINCSVCNTGDIHINGLEGPYTMVTIDGMPIVSSLSSVYGLFGIPSEMIERVEIVRTVKYSCECSVPVDLLLSS